MSREVPDEWAKAMERKGFTHRGKPSISRLAGETTLAIETVRRMVYAIGTPEQRAVNEVADALGVSRITVNQWIGIRRSVEESYEPPADADLMDNDQRQAVDRIIQLLIDQRREGGRADGTAAPTNDPGGDAGGATVTELPLDAAARRSKKHPPKGTTE